MSTVKTMLDDLEREILAKIKALREELAPLESELANINRARAALEPKILPGAGAAHGHGHALAHSAATVVEPIDWADGYKNMTMKDLVALALAEQFKNGATANQLLDFFVHAWKRTDIKR